MEPLRVFGIPVTRPGYYYRNAMTMAQIELMAMDCSVTDYHHNTKKKHMTTDERLKDMQSRTADKDAVNKAAREWQEKYGNGQKVVLDLSGYDIPKAPKTYTLDDLKKISEEQKE